MAEQVPETRIEIELPAEVAGGIYADFLSLWHTPHGFTLDFAALTAPAQASESDTGTPVLTVPARIVARVRIPPGQVFEMMKALEQQLSMWELETGQRQADSDPNSP